MTTDAIATFLNHASSLEDIQKNIQKKIIESVYIRLRKLSSSEHKTTDDVVSESMQVVQSLLESDWKSAVQAYHEEQMARMQEAARLDEEAGNRDTTCYNCHVQMKIRDVQHSKIKPVSYLQLCASCVEEMRIQYTRICCLCDTEYTAERINDEFRLCSQCYSKDKMRELQRIRIQNERARVAELESTLDLKWWLKTLEYFDWKCAYCPNGSYEDLEHYLPISLGGGTTIDNCLPSCGKCNSIKKGKHPDVFTCLFPAENIARICGYFESVSSLV